MPKVWRTSPPGFVPVIKVSGLDLTQAWSLKKTAQRADAEGQTETAVQAWLTAVANNPADPELVRGFLGSLERDENRPNHLAWAIGQSFWLLRLTRTNLADLVLTTRLLERFQLYDLVRDWLEAPGVLQRPALEAAYLRALFHTGRTAAYPRPRART